MHFVKTAETYFHSLENCFRDCGSYSIYKREIFVNMDSKKQVYSSKLHSRALNFVNKDSSFFYLLLFLLQDRANVFSLNLSLSVKIPSAKQRWLLIPSLPNVYCKKKEKPDIRISLFLFLLRSRYLDASFFDSSFFTGKCT